MDSVTFWMELRVELQENHASSKTHPLVCTDVVSDEDNGQQQHKITGKCH